MNLIFASLLVLCIFQVDGKDSSPSFKIDYTNSQFLLDGDPFRYLAGEIHYFRIPHKKWDDRLKRVRAMGLNAITVPVPWNLHQFDEDETPVFSGDLDLVKFIETAATNGLYVIMRIGPYISAGWDNGGLPWWLIRRPNLTKYRSSDPVFIAEVTQWWKHLLTKLYPLMRKNNGPIIMVQIEHLYGQLGICDQQYLATLATLAQQHLGDDVVLFTTDPPVVQFMRCGVLINSLPTIELAPENDLQQVKNYFALQQAFAKKGSPLVASQFIIGPNKMWGNNVTDNYSIDEIINTAKMAYSLNASFSFHLAHGGTNFGYWNGRNDPYPITTSFDSFAPIAEAGDTTMLFLAIRNWIVNIPGWQFPPIAVPSNLPRTAYPDVNLGVFGTISDFIIGTIPECWQSVETPRTAEFIRHGYGYVYYNTTFMDCGTLSIPNFADDAYIFLNRNFVGALYKQFAHIHNNTMYLSGCLDNINTLEIVVEISGRAHNFYPVISRGLQGDVYINNATLEEWYSCQVPIETYEISLVKNYDKIRDLVSSKLEEFKVNPPSEAATLQPSVFIGNLYIKHDAPVDTFLDTRGWGKGVVTINQYNIGRYWSTVGPQQTLFIPSEFLKKGDNLIMFYEFEGATTACSTTSCTAKFTNLPIFDY